MKIRTLFSSAFAAFLIAAGAYNTHAQTLAPANDVPRTISYQGVLADNGGNKLPDGNYRITLSLYADPAGSLKVWQDTYEALVINGIFNLYLGAGESKLPDLAAMNTALWIGTQVGDAPQMYPLTPLSASPYALNVPDRAITTGKLADGAVTADKVDMPYIAGVQINDREIAGTGTVLKLKGSDAITLDYDETTNSVTIGAGNAAERGTSGDGEKGAAVQDAIIGGTNWLGRTLGGSLPFYVMPYGGYNTLAGGALNSIGSQSEYSTVTGGYSNDIAASADYNFIGGGERNYIDAFWSVIAGGDSNTVVGASSAISGGSGNVITGTNSTIAGGGAWNTPNTIEGNYSFIGTGAGNTIEYSEQNAIASGSYNRIHEGATHSMIGAGTDNQIHDNTDDSFIGSGLENQIMSNLDGSAIGSGQYNDIGASYSFIGSGAENTVNGTHSAVGSGHQNSIFAPYSFIGGGRFNVAATSFGGTNAVIGGGESNATAGDHAAITGGEANQADGDWSAIIGGTRNNVQTNYGTIGGGSDNLIIRDYATIGGGLANSAEAPYSAVPGGDHLKTTGYAHAAVGFYNAPRGFLTSIPTTTAKATNNDPLFMVGNGTPTTVGGVPTPSNAFEVSYNGHSVVYDVNGATRTPIRGATYVDNIVYAWGDINSNATINADFGVVSVTPAGVGRYRIRIAVNDPVTGAPVTLTQASITVTAIAEGVDPGVLCYMVNTTRIGNPGPNEFIVNIKNGNCVDVNASFMFKVTGRP